MKKWTAIIFFLLIYAADIPSVLGCSCLPTEGVRKELKEASAVFSGKFIGTEYRKRKIDNVITTSQSSDENKSEAEILVLKFRAESWWKGKFTRDVLIFTDRTRSADGSETISDCDFPFEKGKRYLVYTFSDEGRLKTNLCTRTQLLAKAGEDLKLLGKGRKPGRIR